MESVEHGDSQQAEVQQEPAGKGKAGFVDVRTRRGRLIFRFDPHRLLVEWRDGKDAELIDLTQYM